jgi:pyroglutamyl-peptidase
LRLKKLQDFLPVLLAKSNLPDSILIKTSVDLEKLVAGLSKTEISYEAGKFVCEGLYYEILKHLQKYNLNVSCIFVHVPVLTQDNLPGIIADFRIIMQKMANFANIH